MSLSENFVFGRGKKIKVIDFDKCSSEEEQLLIYKNWIKKPDFEKSNYVNKNSLEIYLKFKLDKKN
jgi:hypothetical protein